MASALVSVRAPRPLVHPGHGCVPPAQCRKLFMLETTLRSITWCHAVPQAAFTSVSPGQSARQLRAARPVCVCALGDGHVSWSGAKASALAIAAAAALALSPLPARAVSGGGGARSCQEVSQSTCRASEAGTPRCTPAGAPALLQARRLCGESVEIAGPDALQAAPQHSYDALCMTLSVRFWHKRHPAYSLYARESKGWCVRESMERGRDGRAALRAGGQLRGQPAVPRLCQQLHRHVRLPGGHPAW